MLIRCYECQKLFREPHGFYVERHILDPNTIPAQTETTGFGYCSAACAERHHILAHDSELQDFGNYEETNDTILVTTVDGGVRGEFLRRRDLIRR